MRSRALLQALAVVVSTLSPVAGVSAQPREPAPPLEHTASAAPSTEEFLRFAVSSAQLQAQAAALAMRKEARDEVKRLAAQMLAYRRTQLQRLAALGAPAIAADPSGLQFEHRVILENLEPLDYLALSRRWSEVQIQALQQESRALDAYAAGAEAKSRPDIVAFVGEHRPALEQFAEQAMKVRQAVGP